MITKADERLIRFTWTNSATNPVRVSQHVCLMLPDGSIIWNDHRGGNFRRMLEESVRGGGDSGSFYYAENLIEWSIENECAGEFA